MKIGITGASGHYGRKAVELLLARVAAEDLVLLSRSPDRLAGLEERGCIVRHGDFDDAASLAASLRGVEQMLLISTGRVGRRVPQHSRAIDAAKAAGVRRIAYTSFISVQPDSPALVAADHRGTEAYLRDSGLEWTILRDNQYADALLQAAGPMALRSGAWQSAAGEGRVAFVTRDDCVKSAVAAIAGSGHHGQVYNICGPELLRFEDVARIISDIGGAPIRFDHVSEATLYENFDALGIPRKSVDDQMIDGFAWCSDDMVSFERAIREGWLAVESDDVEKLTGQRAEHFRSFADRKFREPLREAAASQGASAP